MSARLTTEQLEAGRVMHAKLVSAGYTFELAIEDIAHRMIEIEAEERADLSASDSARIRQCRCFFCRAPIEVEGTTWDAWGNVCIECCLRAAGKRNPLDLVCNACGAPHNRAGRDCYRCGVKLKGWLILSVLPAGAP